MRFLVDENLPATIAEGLAGQGHDVLDVAESTHRGQPDSVLWKLAIDERRILVTRDRDFPLGGTSGRPPGVVLVRPNVSMRSQEITALFESHVERRIADDQGRGEREGAVPGADQQRHRPVELVGDHQVRIAVAVHVPRRGRLGHQPGWEASLGAKAAVARSEQDRDLPVQLVRRGS